MTCITMLQRQYKEAIVPTRSSWPVSQCYKDNIKKLLCLLGHPGLYDNVTKNCKEATDPSHKVLYHSLLTQINTE